MVRRGHSTQPSVAITLALAERDALCLFHKEARRTFGAVRACTHCSKLRTKNFGGKKVSDQEVGEGRHKSQVKLFRAAMTKTDYQSLT